MKRVLCGVLFAGGGVILPWLALGGRVESLGLRGLIFLAILAGGAWLAHQLSPRVTWQQAGIFTALFYAAIYRAALFLPDVSDYPLSLGWSEASRYYNASLFFAPQVYGAPAALPVLHPSRYLLQAAPFLLPSLPLWAHRLWQVGLWLAFSLLTGGLLARRLGGRGERLALALWAFLFVFQGPLYYHLSLMVALVLWGWDAQRPARTWAVVLLASAWAGISRVNWFPAPAMLAAALYFLQTPVAGQSWARYLRWPAAWGAVGAGLAFAVEKLYQAMSGAPAWQFGSSFASDLLWYRLLPSATYPQGVLPAALMVSLPLGLALLLAVWRAGRRVHWLRWLGLAGILMVLFVGGLVVSVKIGGGSNLHNLDGYLTLLMVIGAAAALGWLTTEPGEGGGALRLPGALLALAAAFPVAFTLAAGGQWPSRDGVAAASAAAMVKEAAETAAAQGGEVLFISQRHLLTFGAVNDVALVADYEQVFLMEMVMGNNQAYLNAFWQDLESQRFALIVSDPLSVHYQGRLRAFGEENDAFVERVSARVLRCYQPLTTLDEVGVQLLTPRADGCAE